MTKRQAKKITQLDTYKKVRRSWAIKPVTKIKNNKRKTRQQLKRETEEEL